MTQVVEGFRGGTDPLVEKQGDGTHVPLVKILGDVSRLVQSEDLGEGTKYILKSSSTDWLMVRKTYTDTASQMAYASATNNASITLATAWANRTTLNYGTAAEAGA